MKYYIYVLNSKRDNNNYVGFTENLNERLNQYREGKVTSTKYRRPLELVYYEVSFDKEDALHRERYLKTTYGRRYIKNRLKNQIQGIEIWFITLGKSDMVVLLQQKESNFIDTQEVHLKKQIRHLADRKAIRRHLIPEKQVPQYSNIINELGPKLNAFIKSIK